MTATDELRRMLDENGVSYESGGDWFTTWSIHGTVSWEASEYRGYIEITGTHLTPTQAIEAALGCGMCRDAEDSGTDFCCSACGARLYIDTGDTYTMIAADGHTIIKHPNYCPNCGRKVVER